MREELRTHNSKLKTNKGFTLIELLVSISIIAILTALLTANFIGARQRARDGQRKSDLRQIQSALELYRSDNNGYPGAGSITCGNPLSSGSVVYMKKIPCEPLTSSGSSYNYAPLDCTDGLCNTYNTYTLSACLENAKDPQGAGNGSCSSGIGFSVSNP